MTRGRKATTLLPSALRVLDRLPVEPPTPTSQALLALIRASRPDQPEEVLTKAVAEELAAAPEPNTAPPSSRFNFGWDRPKTEAAWARRRQQPTRLTKQMGPRIALICLAILGITTVGGQGLIRLCGFHTAFASIHPGISASCWAWLLGLPIGLMSLPFAAIGARSYLEEKIEALRAQDLGPLEGRLPRPLDDYLQVPECRAYLAAVLASGMPLLLGDDGRHLEAARTASQAHERERQRTMDARTQMKQVAGLLRR